jgi:hypothetical protein
MQTSLSQRRRLIAKLDNEYRLFLKELEEERVALAEAKRLRQERASRRRRKNTGDRTDRHPPRLGRGVGPRS